MRDLINKYAYPIVGVAVALVILLVAFRGCGDRGVINPNTVKGFYVDDETGEEVVLAAKGQWPPLMGKNGRPTLVEAYKYTRDGGKTTMTAYLMKFSDEAVEGAKDLPDGDPRKAGFSMNGRLIRLPGKDQKWVPLNTPEGQEILGATIPGDGPLKQVSPE